MSWDSTYLLYRNGQAKFAILPLGMHEIFKLDLLTDIEKTRVGVIVWSVGKRVHLDHDIELVPISSTEMFIKSELDISILNVSTGLYEDSKNILNWASDYVVEVEDVASFVVKGQICQGWYNL